MNPAVTAVLAGDVAALELEDTLWNGTPLDWATHENRLRARAYSSSAA